MDKRTILEIFRTKTLLDIMRSLDKGIKDDDEMFRRILGYILQVSNQERALGPSSSASHKRALVSICKYYLSEDSSFTLEDVTSYQRILLELRAKCEIKEEKRPLSCQVLVVTHK